MNKIRVTIIKMQMRDLQKLRMKAKDNYFYRSSSKDHQKIDKRYYNSSQ